MGDGLRHWLGTLAMLALAATLGACGMRAEAESVPPTSTHMSEVQGAQTPTALPDIEADPGDPLVGSWAALEPVAGNPQVVVIERASDGRYTITTSTGTTNTVARQEDGSLLIDPDAFFATPWERYSYQPGQDQLVLILASDVDHPLTYRRTE